MSHILVHGVLGRFSDGVAPTEMLVNTRHVTYWSPTADDHVMIHFLHGSGIEISENLADVQELIHDMKRPRYVGQNQSWPQGS